MIKISAHCLLLLGLLAGATPLFAATLVKSIPANEASDVAVGDPIELRFTAPVNVSTLNEATVTLLGPNGPTPVEVLTDDSGQELAALPKQDLLPGSRYTLFVEGAKSRDGATLPMTTLAFTTQTLHTSAQKGADGAVHVSAGSAEAIRELNSDCDNTNNVRGYRFCRNEGNVQGGVFTPGFRNTDGHWRSYVPLPKVLDAGDFASGELPSGTTALFGAVLRIDDQPLANVTVSIGNQTARTDTRGRFVLKGVPNGHQVLFVDGSSANHAGEEYGQFPVAVDIEAGKPNAMPHTMFMPRISARDKVSIASPTTADMVITHPAVPGLEIRIPAGAIVRDRNGKVLSEFAIVPMPVDRSPIPVPANFDQYFSMQPGGAHFEGLTKEGAKGLRTIYPNYAAESNTKKSNSVFYYYDAEHKGWDVYGEGDETGDGRQVNVGENWGSQTFMPEGGGTEGGKDPPADPPKGCEDGDPVDCATGDFVHRSADFTFNDISPVTFTRTYNSKDTTHRSFGRGMMNPYEMFLSSPNQGCVSVKSNIVNEIDLVAGDGAVYPFLIPIGTGITFWNTAVAHTKSTGKFYGATLSFAEGGTTVQLVDGTLYKFQYNCPSMLTSITDRFGNNTNIYYSAGLISKVTFPSGRSVSLSVDAYSSNINHASDSSGRSISYAYDTSNRMTTATYPDGTTEQYTYDGNGKMLTVKDRRGNTMETNQYDANGRVSQQTYVDNSAYQFAYTLSGNTVVATDVTDTRGIVKHIAFNVDGYPTSITKAYGTSLAQTTTYQRFFGNFITSKTDALGRVTASSYDAFGRVLSQTLLAGTPNSATYTYTYTPDFHDVATVTDPLNHTTTYGYTNGCLTSVTDALNHMTTMTCTAAGQPQTITDPLNHTTSETFIGTEPHTLTDGLNHTTTVNTDALGRTTSIIDAMGRESRVTYESSGHIATRTDPLNQTTTYSYDGKGNLTSVTDPNGGATHYSYDSLNRLISRTDALNQTESWTYDGQANVLTHTDRKNQTTSYQYDALNRPTLVTYADGSTITQTFDAGNRLTQIVDSVSGAIARSYDGLDDIVQEQTPQGTVTYTYDAIGRRTAMTPASQAQITYGYDNADRLTSIAQDTQNVAFGYDSANRRTTLMLPNGIVTTYTYDNANQITGMSYANGATTLATLSYIYDASGRRTGQTGGFATERLPTATTGANTFDLNNRQTLWNGFNIYYDVNGDPTTNNGLSPTQMYTFDARHRLTQVQQGGSTIATFSYDALGRRTSKTINGVATSFLYDGNNAVQETQGATISRILTGIGIDERFARDDPLYGQTSFLTDALGSTLALADTSGTLRQAYSYEPYGEVTSTGSSSNPYQYTGRENDGTGLYYYRARYYSPSQKRFISEDPMGLAAGLNEYAYVHNDPVRKRDPRGLYDVNPGDLDTPIDPESYNPDGCYYDALACPPLPPANKKCAHCVLLLIPYYDWIWDYGTSSGVSKKYFWQQFFGRKLGAKLIPILELWEFYECEKECPDCRNE